MTCDSLFFSLHRKVEPRALLIIDSNAGPNPASLTMSRSGWMSSSMIGIMVSNCLWRLHQLLNAADSRQPLLLNMVRRLPTAFQTVKFFERSHMILKKAYSFMAQCSAPDCF
jgi:hypothetical protein